MKSLNVKKIAAIAAGAALIGTAFAGAAVTVDETGLGNFAFFSNGEPNVQVVVGSTAMASDAVAAGNIALMLGNKAYTTSSAPATPAAGSAPQTVSVKVTNAANTVPAGTYPFNSFFGDDRVDVGAYNTYNRTASAPSYNGNLAPTLELSSTQTSLVTDSVINTAGKYSGTINVREFVELFGSADYSTSSDQYVLRTPRAWYSQTYNPGLPSCLDSTQLYAACSTNSQLDRAGIHLRFLGSDYLVTNVAFGTSGAFNSMTLSKASVDQVAEQGAVITTPEGYKVELLSISAPQGLSTVSAIALKVTSPSNSTELVNMNSGDQPAKVLGSVYVQVPNAYYTAATGSKSTARVIFATGSVKMVQNTTIDENIFGKWQVSFTTNNVSTTQAISRLQLGNDFQPGTLLPGGSLDIITGTNGYKWTFQGSSLNPTTDFTTLTVEPFNMDSVQINGNATTCSLSTVRFTSSRSDAFRFGNDQKSQVFWVAKNRSATGCNIWNGVWLYQNSSSVYAASVGGGITPTNQSGAAIVGPGVNSTLTTNITFYYPGSGTDASVSLVVNTSIASWHNFSLAGLGTNGLNSSALYEIAAANTSKGDATSFNVTIPEILNESTATVEGSWNIPFTYGSGNAAGSPTATDLSIRDALGLTTTSKINYTANANGRITADQGAAYFGDVPLYSPRGSYVNSAPTTSGVTINYASKLGRASYLLSFGGANLSSGGVTTVTCTVGTPCTVGGTTITLPSGAVVSGGQSVVTRLNSRVKPLVVLDSGASATQPLIVVGGPFVNTVAAGLTAGASITTEGSDPVVTVEGSKILVAGYSAAGTIEAANALIDWLAAWSPA